MKKSIKGWALFSKWGFHIAYNYKIFAKQELKDAKKLGIDYYVIPVEIRSLKVTKKKK